VSVSPWTVAGLPPKRTWTFAVSVPKRPPLIVTTSPPAQLPEVGLMLEMKGPFAGTGW